MSKQYVARKFRLKPTPEQAEVLTEWCHINRFVWNYFLGLNQSTYAETKKFVFFYDMCKALPALKKEHPFVKQAQSQAVQVMCQRLESAIKGVWQKGNGFPKFKSKKRGDLPSIRIPQCQGQLKWDKTSIQIPKLGRVKWKKHRSLDGKLVNITLSYDGGFWWCVCLVETNKAKPTEGDVVGIDLGLTDWVVTSDGELFDIHPKLEAKEQQVIKAQRQMSRKQRDSKNRAKSKKKLNRAHYRVRCARMDNAHKTSAAIAKQYAHVGLEDLNIKGMMKNRHLARKIAQVSWGQLRSQLEYKTNIHLVDRWFPSSKTCSRCGHVQPMPLQIRTFSCERCGFEMNRDANAAINIRNYVVRNCTTGTVGSHACGDAAIGDEAYDSSRCASLKQENVKVLSSHMGAKFDQDARASSGRG